MSQASSRSRIGASWIILRPHPRAVAGWGVTGWTGSRKTLGDVFVSTLVVEPLARTFGEPIYVLPKFTRGPHWLVVREQWADGQPPALVSVASSLPERSSDQSDGVPAEFCPRTYGVIPFLPGIVTLS